MLNDEEGGHARAAGTAHLSRPPPPPQSSPETPEGPPDRLIHDLAGRRLSKQFKDKVSSFLNPLLLCSARLTSDTTFFLLPPQLRSSSVVKDFLRLVATLDRIILSQQKVDQAALPSQRLCLLMAHFLSGMFLNPNMILIKYLVMVNLSIRKIWL